MDMLGFFLMVTVSSTALASMNSDGETIPASEPAAIKEIVGLIESQVEEGFRKTGHAFRDAHRKHHGCVKAEFETLGSIPDDLKVGVFEKAATRSALIRFSNSSGGNQDDRAGDGRGMAIKVFDVGDRAILRNIDGSSTQDFIMINHPVFFVRSAYDYLKFQQAVAEGAVWKWLLNPKHLLHETLIAQAILAKRITNPLETRYFSQTPYKLSSRQMKFAVRPCAKMVVRNAVKSDMNQLNLNLAHHLSAQEACFDFEVQVRTNAASMPIEDATIEWAEKEAPFVKVARITIPPQIPMIGESCEVASFNPWHSLPEHRPLGAMARVRKEVYEAIARLRLKLNRQL